MTGKWEILISFLKGEIRKTPGSYRPVSVTSASNKITEQTFLKTMIRYIENEEMTDSQHVFTKSTSGKKDLGCWWMGCLS